MHDKYEVGDWVYFEFGFTTYVGKILAMSPDRAVIQIRSGTMWGHVTAEKFNKIIALKSRAGLPSSALNFHVGVLVGGFSAIAWATFVLWRVGFFH